jgi:hypothetical protein
LIRLQRIFLGNRGEDRVRIQLSFPAHLVERPSPSATEIETMATEDPRCRRVGHSQFGQGGGSIHRELLLKEEHDGCRWHEALESTTYVGCYHSDNQGLL